jgi:hypothetical protein
VADDEAKHSMEKRPKEVALKQNKAQGVDFVHVSMQSAFETRLRGVVFQYVH